MALIAATPVVMAQAQPAQTMGPLGTAPENFAVVKTATQFYLAVLGPAEVSLVVSQLAVDKATQKNALEFAGFELAEAITVNEVLKDIGTTAPAMDAKSMGIAKRMQTEAKGRAFDAAYIGFQLDNHEYLRDLSDAYLHNSAGATDPMEKQGRHLALLMHAVFTEHTLICKRITAELKG